jgi:hypothetical protein
MYAFVCFVPKESYEMLRQINNFKVFLNLKKPQGILRKAKEKDI